MNTHTPGPWSVFRPECKHPGIEGSNNVSVVLFGVEEFEDAGVHGVSKEETLANAHLIASAPDLYEACKSLVTYMDKAKMHANQGNPCWLDSARVAECVEAAREAIQKAEGR